MCETGLSEPIWRAGRVRSVGPVRRCRSCKRLLHGKSPVCRSRSALGEHKHAGGLGCRVDSSISGRWNREAPAAWRRLHRRAYQETVRRHGSGSVVLLARVWELQARGLLHVHPVLGYEGAIQMAGARVPRTARGARAAVRLRVRPQQARAREGDAGSERCGVPVVVLREGPAREDGAMGLVRSSAMPRSIIHVSVKLTMRTGCTMRTLRLKRLLFVVWGVDVSREHLSVVDAALRAAPQATSSHADT